MSIVRELKRRNVFRVAAAYAAIAWLVVQVAETVLPVFDAAPGTLRIVVILAAIGFVPAVVIAWLFELTPDGLQRDEGAEQDPGFSRRVHDRLNRIILVFLSLAVVYFAVDKFALSNGGSASTPKEVSIAVLPFVNQSDAEGMVFFSDGVAEDILGLLSRTDGLRCIARSSSFAFRSADTPASVIGERLGVDYLLTGTLRQHGNRVRVNVRLVETVSESLVWSRNFDRSLDDVFAIQDDISRQVVEAVAPSITATQIASRPPSTNDYVAYLKARHVYLQGRNSADPERVHEARQLFEELLRDSPDYSRAHAGLADVWSGLAILGAVATEEGYTRATESALRALEIDPGNAEAWYALGDIRVEFNWDLPAAQAAYDRAVALAPQDADGLRGYAYFLRQSGQTDKAVATYKRALSIDPLSPRAISGLYITFVNSRRYADAEAVLEDARKINPSMRVDVFKAPIYVQRQEFARLDAVATELEQFVAPPAGVYFRAVARRGLGNQSAGDEIILEALATSASFTPSNAIVAQYFSFFGEFDKAIEYLDKAVASREIGLGEMLTAPSMAELRKDPDFWSWVERAGIKPLE